MTKTRFQVLAVVLLAGILVLVLSHLYAATTSSSPASQVGRYQLFDAHYTEIDAAKNTTFKHQETFLLDTATGTVKEFTCVATSDGSLITWWQDTEQTRPATKQ